MEVIQTPAPRTQLHLGVSYKKSYAREATQGTLKNISLTGCFLEFGEAQNPLQPNEKLTLNLEVSGRERKIAATVVWANESGCGVKFHPTNNRDVQIVDDLIYFVETKRIGTKSVLDEIFKKAA